MPQNNNIPTLSEMVRKNEGARELENETAADILAAWREIRLDGLDRVLIVL